MALRALTEHTHATSKAGCKSKTRHTTIVTGENKSDRHTAESVRVSSFYRQSFRANIVAGIVIYPQA